MRSKALILITCLLLLCGSTIAQTLAYMFDWEEKVNTFTVGNVRISLDETMVGEDGEPVTGENGEPKKTKENTYYIQEIDGEIKESYLKDPAVTLMGGSEDSWIFVQLTPTPKFTQLFEEPAIAAGWIPLDEVKYPGVYYRSAAGSKDDQDWDVLQDNLVRLDTQQDLEKILGEMNYNQEKDTVKLSIKAYAIQQKGIDKATEQETVEYAWSLIPEDSKLAYAAAAPETTATPAAPISETPAETSTPTETSEPTEASAPVETSEPEETSEPTETSEPEETSDPTETSETSEDPEELDKPAEPSQP